MHDVSLLVSWKTCGFKSYVCKYKILACTNNKTKAKFLPNYTKTKLNDNKISTYLVLKLNLTTYAYNKINFYLILKLNYN